LILLVCLIAGIALVVGCIGHYVLLQGVIDEVNLPLANCDTSMYEELLSEDK
jgi:hypothetical protein